MGASIASFPVYNTFVAVYFSLSPPRPAWPCYASEAYRDLVHSSTRPQRPSGSAPPPYNSSPFSNFWWLHVKTQATTEGEKNITKIRTNQVLQPAGNGRRTPTHRWRPSSPAAEPAEQPSNMENREQGAQPSAEGGPGPRGSGREPRAAEEQGKSGK